MSIQRTGASGAPSIQWFQAQQAFNPKPVKDEVEEFTPGLPVNSSTGIESETVSSALGSSNNLSRIELPIDDIQRIAKSAGYVGLSERDIHRAYVLGESLLADYRV